MKKKISALFFAFIMCLSLLPINTLAASPTLSTEKASYGPYTEITVTYTGVTQQMIDDGAWIGIGKVGGSYVNGSEYWEYVDQFNGTVVIRLPMDAGNYDVRLYKDGSNSIDGFVASTPLVITSSLPKPDGDSLDYSGYVPVSGSWTGTYETNWGEMVLTETGGTVSGNYTHDSGKINGTVSSTGILIGTWSESPSYSPPNDAGDIIFFMLEGNDSFVGYWRYGSTGSWVLWEPAKLTSAPPAYNASEWALEEIAQADALGLIPDVLEDANLTKPITRAEFAAVAVKAYEALSGIAAIPAINNPFSDCTDVEVLKAYNIGAVNGVSTTAFAPDDLLNREQAATMLTRVFKKVSIVGWTLATDGDFKLEYTKPAAFADDAAISVWAKDSVYFMVANDIIKGVGNNVFAPKNTTSTQEATGYANATREQALVIAVRMVQNLMK